MQLTGKHYLVGAWQAQEMQGFQALNPTTQALLPTWFAEANADELLHAIRSAEQAFTSYAQCAAGKKAEFLRQIAIEIEQRGDFITEIAMQETGLPQARLEGERGRTCNQLRLFADTLEQGQTDIVDAADENRQPIAKPSLILTHIPLGPVAVFAASNFPLAFSVAGGDTASALAAGCPVVFKAHIAHPGTSEIVAQAIAAAIEKCAMPKGVFSLIQGKSYQLAEQLVKHPSIKAVAFTGSERVGLILQQHIQQRSEPIPFYGELGSINPQFIFEHKLATEAESLAKQFVDSLMMGQGQFCTSPGIWLMVKSKHSQIFMQAACEYLCQQVDAPLLTTGILASYQSQSEQWQQINGVELIAAGAQTKAHFAQPKLFKCDLSTYLANPILQQELFGPAALIVECQSQAEYLLFIDNMQGNLTASIHANSDDITQVKTMQFALSQKVGRLIFNQMPTGVEVSKAMNHGGPFPASTDLRTTSVGTQAMQRFLRPLCLQNLPENW